MKNRLTLAHVLLLATALVWGATFTLVKSALHDASPLLFNFIRMTVAAVALALVNRRQLRSISRSNLRAGALAGLFLAAGYEFQTVGLAHTTAVKSAFITGLVVVFVPALTLIPVLRPAGTPRPGIGVAFGALSAFAGLLLLTTPPGSGIGQIFRFIHLGDLLTLVCALAFAAHLLTLAQTAKDISPGLLATLQITVCAGLMSLALPLEPARLTLTPRLLLALAVCALLATAAAFTIQSYAQQRLPAAHSVLLLTLEPVFAWLTSMLVLGERLSTRGLAGAALILAGVLIVEFIPSSNATEIPA